MSSYSYDIRVIALGFNIDNKLFHYSDVVMGTMASQISSLAIVYANAYSVADQRKHQSSTSLAFVQGIHRWPVNSPHKWPVTRKMCQFDDGIMSYALPPLHTGRLFDILVIVYISDCCIEYSK